MKVPIVEPTCENCGRTASACVCFHAYGFGHRPSCRLPVEYDGPSNGGKDDISFDIAVKKIENADLS